MSANLFNAASVELIFVVYSNVQQGILSSKFNSLIVNSLTPSISINFRDRQLLELLKR
jgi:hypothetical protein